MKNIYLLFTLFTSSVVFAQVGIGTLTPDDSAQLDVFSSNKGVLIPQVALLSTTNNTTPIVTPKTSLLVYNTASVSDVTPGYYYWSGSRWNRLVTEAQGAIPKFFYMPSIAMPTSSAHFVTGDGFTESGGVFRVNLHGRYQAQFATPEVKNPTQTTTLPTLPANKLDYYITSYDKAVFESVAVSNAGVLTYKIKTTAQVTAATFMNIVFAVKP